MKNSCLICYKKKIKLRRLCKSCNYKYCKICSKKLLNNCPICNRNNINNDDDDDVIINNNDVIINNNVPIRYSFRNTMLLILLYNFAILYASAFFIFILYYNFF